jgi:Trk K+ transport system NAD-binding subunit
MIDANPEFCAQAQAENLQVLLTSALDMKALNEAGVGTIGSFLTITSNPEVNSVLAQRVLEEFHPPRVLAALPEAPLDSQLKVPSETLTTREVMPAFSTQLSVKDWSAYVEAQEVKISEVTLDEDPDQFQRQLIHLRALSNVGKLMPLLVIRQDALRIAKADEVWQPEDRVIYLLHTPKMPLSARSPTETGAPTQEKPPTSTARSTESKLI